MGVMLACLVRLFILFNIIMLCFVIFIDCCFFIHITMTNNCNSKDNELGVYVRVQFFFYLCYSFRFQS